MIYLDNNATTPLDPKIREWLHHALDIEWGNPSSVLQLGRKARGVIEDARERIAHHLGVRSREIFFTSGATEGLNGVMRGVMEGGGHMITSSFEHAAVFETAKALAKRPHISVTFLERYTLEAVREALCAETKLVVLMAANNETGEVYEWERIAAFLQELGIPFLVDGVQLLGKKMFTISEGVSAMVFSGHKVHAPKGVGFVYLSTLFRPSSQMTGGGQEWGWRSGTENVCAIHALGMAIELISEEHMEKMRHLRDSFEAGIATIYPHSRVHADDVPRLPNTSNICFSGLDGEALLFYLDQQKIEASLGSACASGSLEPSRVLLQCGVSSEDARASLRFSFSRMNTEKEIEETLAAINVFITRQCLIGV